MLASGGGHRNEMAGVTISKLSRCSHDDQRCAVLIKGDFGRPPFSVRRQPSCDNSQMGLLLSLESVHKANSLEGCTLYIRQKKKISTIYKKGR